MQKAGLKHCPAQCPNETKPIDIYRTKYCDLCPWTREYRTFQEGTKERWEQWLGDEAAGFDFEQMLSALYDVTALKDMPNDRLTVKGSAMLDIFMKEKERLSDKGV